MSKLKERVPIKDEALKLVLNVHFEKGETAPTNLYELLRTKYKFGKQRFFKIANDALTEWSSLKKKAQNEQITQLEKEAVKEAVMSRVERQKILTQIARGEIPLRKAMVVDGIIEYIDIVPDWMDRKQSIAELNKMEGDYAPTKTELSTDPKNPFITQTNVSYSTEGIDYSKLPTAFLEQLVQSRNS